MLSLPMIRNIFSEMENFELMLSIFGLFSSPLIDLLKPVRQPLEKAYRKALKKWAKNNDIRERIARNKFAHFIHLQDYIISSGRIANQEIASLLQLWEKEIKEDIHTYSKLLTLCNTKENLESSKECNQMLRSIQADQMEGFHRLELQIANLIRSISDGNGSQKYKVQKFSSLPYYISRGVREYASINTIDLFFNPSEYTSKPLLDYIIESKEKKFLLYSDAQCGKSTEISQLAYVLQQSELYNPILFKLARYIPTRSLQEQINYNNVFSEAGIGVILLDGLDEIKDSERSNIIYEIEAMAEEFSHIYFIISCRSNFETTNDILGFKKLYLDELSYKDVVAYIENNCKKSQQLLREIANKQLYDVIYNPFYLHSIVQYFNEKETLPVNKTMIYDFIIDSCFDADNKRGGDRVSRLNSLKSEGFSLLKKLAFCLQCSNKQYFTDVEWFDELKCTREDLELCCKFSIFKREQNNLLSFKHNAFKEFIVAKQLQTLSFDQLMNCICFSGTNKLAPSWYNVIILLVGLLDKNDRIYNSLMDWLINNENELLIKCDTHFLNYNRKFEIFASIFNYYKSLQLIVPYGLKISLMKFAYGGKTTMFLIDEICSIQTYNTSLISALVLLKYADFSVLLEDEQEKSKKVLLACLVKFQNQEDAGDYLLAPFSNHYYCNAEIIKEIYSIIKNSTNRELLCSFFNLLVKSGLCNEYADWVFTKVRYIHNYNKDGYTVIVSKRELYEVFGQFTRAQYISKVLFWLRDKQLYSEERKLKKQLFSNAEIIYKQDREIVDEIVKVLMTEELNSYHDSSDQLFEDLELYRNFFFDNKEDSSLYDKYLSESIKSYSLLRKSQGDIEVLRGKLSSCVKVVSTLMTDERLESLLACDKFSENDLYLFTSWIFNSTFIASNEIWMSKIEARFKKFVMPKRDWKKEYQEAFDILFNFSEFKDVLANLANENEFFPLVRSERRKISEKGINKSVEDFICSYEEDDEEYVNLKKIISLLDEEVFRQYAYTKMYKYIYQERYELEISEDQKDIIKKWVIGDISDVVNAEGARRPMRLIKRLNLEIDTEYLIHLLPYSYENVTSSSSTRMISSPFFDYLKIQIKKDTLDSEIERILKYEKDNSAELYLCLGAYVVDSNLAGCYKYLIQLLFCDIDGMLKVSFQIEMIYRILKSGNNSVELLLRVHEKLEFQAQVFLFEKICQKEELFSMVDTEFLITELEKLYTPGENDETILGLLMLCGSKSALLRCIEYVQRNKYAFYDHSFSLKNYGYDQIDHIFMLLKLGLKQDFASNEPFSITKVSLAALERLSLYNIQCRDYIIDRVKQLAASDDKYAYLNYYVLNWYNKYFEVNNENVSIEQAIQRYELLYS